MNESAAGDPADLILTDASVYTMGAERRSVSAVAVKDGRIAAVGTDAETRELIGAEDRGAHALRPDGRPGFPGRPCPSGVRRAEPAAAAPGSSALGGCLSRRDRRVCVRSSRRAVDHRRRLGDVPVPGGHASQGGPRPARSRPSRVPDEPRRARRVGEQPCARARGDHARTRRIRGTVGSSAIPRRGSRPARCTKAPRTRSATGSSRRRTLPNGARRCSWRSGTCTRSASPAGRTRGSTPDLLEAYEALDDAGELTAHVSASLWWDRHRGDEQVDELVERGRAATRGNVRATTVKIMTDGVVENCSCSLLQPYDDPDGYPSGHRGLSYVGGDALRSAVVRLDAAGVPGAHARDR